MRLVLNESVTFRISARTKYSLDQLQVIGGETYTFQVDPKNSCWWDMIIPSFGEGWDMFLSPRKGRRLPSKPLLYLCACMDREDSQAFGIGKYLEEWKVSKDGVLSFFANDYPTMYFNNWGTISLKITRVS